MENPFLFPVLAGALALGVGVLVTWLVLRTGSASSGELSGRLAQMADSLAAQQAQLADRLQSQERQLGRVLEERLTDMGKRLHDGLDQSSLRTGATLSELRERLAVIDSAQANIAQLSERMVSLQDILSNKQARGAFGEIQLQDLISQVLPPQAYEFQAPIGERRRVDCLIKLPRPPGSIAIDAKFPLESFHQLRSAKDDSERTQAGRAFATAVLTHVRDISEKYIVPGETAESALMFLPSESVYAELYANFPEVVEKSYRARVWIVSPTTLMATLTTIRAVLKDARMREQADVIQAQVRHLLDDVKRLAERAGNLEKHFTQAGDDLRLLKVSVDKVVRHSEQVEAIQLGDSGKTEDVV
ncbi:MAG: DNA recombination protein RmuC [Alphaproteobacteria bacterium]|nr:DNA recombination protein RmuC [Alphaproteobacteria bacterium]